MQSINPGLTQSQSQNKKEIYGVARWPFAGRKEGRKKGRRTEGRSSLK
jgi:hypothetical protein